jgi:hypothetical protein
MTPLSNTSPLPARMALIETADGRWYPAFTPLTDTPHWVTLLDAGLIPPAVEPCHHPAQGYASREDAREACHAWHEAAVLEVQWQILASHTEVYPERNAWYLEEIAHLTGNGTPLLACGTDVYAVLIADRSGCDEVISATGMTIDEAIETLYQCVYAWSCQHQGSTRAC